MLFVSRLNAVHFCSVHFDDAKLFSNRQIFSKFHGFPHQIRRFVGAEWPWVFISISKSEEKVTHNRHRHHRTRVEDEKSGNGIHISVAHFCLACGSDESPTILRKHMQSVLSPMYWLQSVQGITGDLEEIEMQMAQNKCTKAHTHSHTHRKIIIAFEERARYHSHIDMLCDARVDRLSAARVFRVSGIL